MPPESKRFLADLRDAANSILQFSAGRVMSDLTNDILLRSAVYWQFAIIGEALSQLRKQDQPALDRISESSRIIGFRNQILHGYQSIQDNITWQIIQDKLPILLAEVEQLLKE